jgi:hypothetical protein
VNALIKLLIANRSGSNDKSIRVVEFLYGRPGQEFSISEFYRALPDNIKISFPTFSSRVAGSVHQGVIKLIPGDNSTPGDRYRALNESELRAYLQTHSS